jgi:hypothetical protein
MLTLPDNWNWGKIKTIAGVSNWVAMTPTEAVDYVAKIGVATVFTVEPPEAMTLMVQHRQAYEISRTRAELLMRQLAEQVRQYVAEEEAKPS